MIPSPVPAHVLSMRILPNADPALLGQLTLRDGDRSLGLLTADCDDVAYAALDEATKKADVQVAYARSMYAGASNASTRLAGEFLGILSGPDPDKMPLHFWVIFPPQCQPAVPQADLQKIPSIQRLSHERSPSCTRWFAPSPSPSVPSPPQVKIGLQPTAPPIDVMLMIVAVISAASCMQAAGGLPGQCGR